MAIIPPGAFGGSGDEQAPAPSFGVLLVRVDGDVTHESVVEALTSARFTGWVSPEVPVEGDDPGDAPVPVWTVAVPETPLGHVAGERTTLHELAASLAATLDGDAIAMVNRREQLLTLTADRAGERWVDYVSDAHLARPDDEFAWGPEGAYGAGALARLCGRPEAEESVYELLSEDEGDDVNESERIVALGRLLGWPHWLVSVGGLPKRVFRGPDVKDFLRLRAGATGIGGRVKGRLTKVKRRSDLTQGG
ncbi:hypothetical protein EDD28_2932 [Salana multivorans]|uniref:Uncharacterized protein n=1 Tax=Salana multivorans TaxID=120377 RepID=A0A3N2D169_9MICO|nr:hypothetical protein [Salana multivorans]ROR93516.1 hypothetical protein EDD28_2932 [Salana multivorans]